MKIAEIIGVVIALVVGLTMTPVVFSSVDTAANGTTGAVAALLGLVKIMYVIILVAGSAAYVYIRR